MRRCNRQTRVLFDVLHLAANLTAKNICKLAVHAFIIASATTDIISTKVCTELADILRQAPASVFVQQLTMAAKTTIFRFAASDVWNSLTTLLQ